MKYNLTLIYPAHKKNLGNNKKKRGKYPIPQLSLPTVAGLTDERFNINIVDEIGSKLKLGLQFNSSTSFSLKKTD